jgi:putative intracellular protease/amidase
MRKTLLIAVIGLAALSVTACLGMAQQKGKVLMIVNEGKSEDLELMLTKEVGVMKGLLQKAGFEIVVATASNQPMAAGSAKLKPNLKLSDVKVTDYKGVIMPCMATSGSPLPPEGTAIIKEAVAKGKPLAAQTGSVVLLSQAGVLKGKKYALAKGWPAIEGAIYSGVGIVQDGKIITSGICPYMAKSQGTQAQGMQDGTSKLTEALIAELKK